MGVGGVHGTFEVTASSTTFGDGAAVFTADQGDTVAYKGGYLDGFDPLNCRVGAVGP